MLWQKLDFIYNADQFITGFRGAAVPCVMPIENGLLRIFYSPRDRLNRSHIFALDFNIEELQIVKLYNEAVLGPGELGEFDDSGAMISCITKNNGFYNMYYIGWNLGKIVPFHNSIGLAKSTDGIHYDKCFKGPIIDRTKDEPHFCASNWVIKENIFRMWYVTNVKWEKTKDGNYKHYYHINYGESDDGINWKRNGLTVIDFKNNNEYAISRPCIIKGKNCYHMWYSYRGDEYRIGYATSEDGLKWTRKDGEVGITVSDNSFDSNMICYPCVFQHKEDFYMLYNGNGYGMEGFGVAKLIKGVI